MQCLAKRLNTSNQEPLFRAPRQRIYFPGLYNIKELFSIHTWYAHHSMYILPEEKRAVIQCRQTPCIQMTRSSFVTIGVRDTIFLGLQRVGSKSGGSWGNEESSQRTLPRVECRATAGQDRSTWRFGWVFYSKVGICILFRAQRRLLW